jgi:hypothetical protein
MLNSHDKLILIANSKTTEQPLVQSYFYDSMLVLPKQFHNTPKCRTPTPKATTSNSCYQTTTCQAAIPEASQKWRHHRNHKG